MTNDSQPTYLDLRDFFAQTGLRKAYIAARLGIEPYELSRLLNPDHYRPKVDGTMVVKIAALLNQPVEYVERLYGKAA